MLSDLTGTMHTMNAAMVGALLIALVAGMVIGWLLHASRSSAALAAARAEADAVRTSHDLASRSLVTVGEDVARRQSSVMGAQMSHIVDPLRAGLSQLGDELRRLEHHRASAYAGLSEQVRGMHAASTQLNEQTRQLTNALHTPHVRGRWGELQLERVVELAGMTRHCDFTTQVSGTSEASGDIRPDLVVHLAGGRDIVVDAKVPLHAYLQACGATDPDVEATRMREHARALRTHVGQLSAKSYWSAFDNTPELVVLFVPSDPVLEAALRVDPDLIEYAFGRSVIPATPSTLMALLRTVALGWRHDAMARDAAVIHELGTELHHRLGTVLGHVDRLGGSLRKTVESFNSTVGAIDSRLGVTARKLAELEGLGDAGETPAPTPVDERVRCATSPAG
jgi:DNA recombination protein RmuC